MRAILLSINLTCLAYASAHPQTPAVWNLSETPLVEIGVAEGDPNYELFDARSSVKLLDGRIVILNAGTADLRFFDANGKFLFKVGRRGNGPGEYRSPARVYYTHRDSLLVYDQVNNRESHLDTNGKFVVSSDGAPVKADLFKRDVWLYRRNLVDGPALAAERSRVKPALDGLPSLAPGQYRYVKIDPWYRLWVRSPRPAQHGDQSWTVFTADGQSLATLVTPSNFEIHQVGPDFLLGRSRLDLDVETIRLYPLRGAGVATKTPPFTAASARPYTPAGEPAIDTRHFDALRSYLRHMMSQQEIHYSKANTYSSDITRLSLPDDKDITPYILQANGRGWAMLAVHRDADVLCAVAQGAAPIGWSPGRAACGETRMRR